MFTIADIAFALVTAALVLALLILRKKRLVAGWILLFVFVFLWGVRLSGFRGSSLDAETFRNVDIQNVEAGDELVIRLRDGKKQLYNATKDDWVMYENFAFQHYEFVYLAEVGDFTVAVISTDPAQSFEDGRFYQADMERLEGIDQLLFLDKNHAVMHAFDERELIGRSIDLFSMQANADIVAYKVFHPYSDKTFAYYASFFLYSEHGASMFTMSPTLSPSIYFYPIIGGQSEGVVDNIDAFLLGRSSEMLIVAPNAVEAIRITIDVTIVDGYIQSYGPSIDELSIAGGDALILQGYCMVLNGRIYYLDADRNLRVLGQSGILVEDVGLSNWTDSIPDA